MLLSDAAYDVDDDDDAITYESIIYECCQCQIGIMKSSVPVRRTCIREVAGSTITLSVVSNRQRVDMIRPTQPLIPARQEISNIIPIMWTIR